MNARWIMPPFLALVFVVSWSGSDRDSTTKLEKESKALMSCLAAQSSGFGADTSSGVTKSSTQTGPWKTLTALAAEAQRTGSKLAMMRLEQHCQGMTPEALISALDEIDASGTSRKLSSLKERLFQQLCKKDPKSALARSVDSSREDRQMISGSLINAMMKWPQQDLAMAETWLAEQIAAGKFDSATYDGQNPLLARLENGLKVAQILLDPANAAARLSALSEEQRTACLWTYSSTQIREEDQLAFSQIIRAFMSEDDRSEVFSSFAVHLGPEAASNQVLGKPQALDFYHFPNDYAPVSKFLDRIGATPTEREKCVEQTVIKKFRVLPQPGVSFEQIDVLHAWATEQAPNKADNLTSQVLWHKARRGSSFAEVAKQAVRYSNASGNDNLLFEFLTKKVPAADQGAARILAEKIIDPARCQIVLDGLK